MTTLFKNPSRSTRSLSSWYHPLDRFLRNDFDFWNNDSADTVPSINITEDKGNYKIEMAAPGLKKEDFNIDVEGNLLTISCEKKTETKEGNDSDNYSRREYNYSSFSRSLTLPEDIDGEKVNAKYIDGILNLTIPKKEDLQKNKSQKIKVE
jgi:HSP20 family protein